MLHLTATIEPVLCGKLMHAEEAIHRCVRIDINQAVTSTSSPTLDFGYKIYVFLDKKYLTVSSE